MRPRQTWCVCFLLFDECSSYRKPSKSITIPEKETRIIAEIWSCTRSCAQFCMLSFYLHIFIYNNTLGIYLCFKAKGHGTRMTSEEQSLKWWGFLQDEMRFALFFVISRTLFYQDYIYMYILLPSCPHFKLDIYPITFQ